jgi:phosphoglycerate dehydrogenase-like enzyme
MPSSSMSDRRYQLIRHRIALEESLSRASLEDRTLGIIGFGGISSVSDVPAVELFAHVLHFYGPYRRHIRAPDNAAAATVTSFGNALRIALSPFLRVAALSNRDWPWRKS